MICLHTKFHMPNFNDSLIKPSNGEPSMDFMQPAFYYFTFYERIA
jgi:hypothetical protein